MFFKKLVCIFLLVSLVGRISIAQETKPVFTHIKAGEPAKFTGYLFSPEAIAQVYSVCEEDVKLCKLNCEGEITTLNLEIQRVTELKLVEIAVKDKLITDITKLKDSAITERDKLILNIEEERDRNKFYFAGAFISGILLTGTIFYFANIAGK